MENSSTITSRNGTAGSSLLPLRLADLVGWCCATTDLAESQLDCYIHGLNMDSRLIGPRDVFIALKGDGDDGHNYVAKAFENGAMAAIVEAASIAKVPSALRGKCIIVHDPLIAVQQMAAAYRRQLGIPVIAVTGSNGKTTTRIFISTVLSGYMAVGATRGNWNNHIGVPLSLLHFSGGEKVGIIEMGANHSGEIHALSLIAQPDIACITNIGYAHVGLFGNLHKTTLAKFEIVDGMKSGRKLLLVNGDDPRLVKQSALSGCETILFGTSRRCHVRAIDINISPEGTTAFSVNGYRYTLATAGRHFIFSALPAIYCAEKFGMMPEVIDTALRTILPDPLRGRMVDKSSVRFIVDCYNANPTSMMASIRLLCDVSGTRKRCAIVGDMLELGSYSRRLHVSIGRYLGNAGVEKVLAIGQFAGDVARGAHQAGIREDGVVIAATTAEAVPLAKSMFRDGDIVLLKGSRGMKLEQIFNVF